MIRARPFWLFTLLLLFLLAGVIGGPSLPIDGELVARMGLWRIEHPEPAGLMIWITHLGGSFVLVPLALLVAGYLLWRGRRLDALLLLGTSLSGRAMVELIKLLVDRPRPSFEPYPVYVSSQSFPSGHAANSMITYLAIAVFALPARWRRAGIAAATILAVAIGTTRPALGVHWPTDVIGGWCLGLVWVALWWRFRERANA